MKEEGIEFITNIEIGKNITVTKPSISYDLPAGGKRLTQKAEGYKNTFVNGIEVSHNGEFTGNMPGKLIRGPQTIN